MHGIADLAMPKRVVYGSGAATALQSELRERNVTRAFLLTTPSLVGKAFLKAITEALGPAIVGTHTGLTAHTPDTGVLDAACQAREARAQALIAVGGGSVIDGAKIVRLCVDERFDSREAIAVWRNLPHVEAGLRTSVFAVPTTLSAAEFSGIAGMLDTQAGRKSGLHHSSLVPDVVILDPVATTTAPDWLVFSSGIRAVDHCVETILSSRPNPFADASALHGLKLLAENLPAMRAAPDDLQPRQGLQFGMWLSMVGPCIGVPLGASHAIGRALGGTFAIPHGRTSCVMLAPALAWNAEVDAARQAQLNGVLPNRRENLSSTIKSLIEALGEPARIRDLDISRDDLSRVIEPSLAMLKLPSTCGNVRPVRGADDVREILELAW